MDMQNVSNLAIPEGEVKSIHDKDSRLLWGAVGYDTKYAGDTHQQTYSGKNLIYTNPRTNLGIKASYDASTGVTTISGQATDTYATFNVNNLVLPTGTYTLSTQQPAPVYIGVGIRISGGTRTPFAVYPNDTSRTFTLPGNMVGYDVYISGLTIGTNYNFSFKLQLEQGSTATAFEPYVGGIPSPNPDYPQDVNVVTGEQTVNVSGKNLFNASADTGSLNGVNYKKNGDGTYTVNGTANGTSSFVVGSIELTANTQYVVSGCPGTGSGSSYNVRIRDANYTALGFDVGNGATITPTETKTYYYQITVVSGYSVSNLVFKPMICKLQVEEGTVATAYEPYQGQSYPISLGSIELCKIGDYQDYIYKSGDDWYLHKVINKVILNGSEAWAMYSGRNGTFYMTKSDIMPAPSIDTTPNVISDYYEPEPFRSLYDRTIDYGVANHNAQRWIAIRNKDCSDVSSFKTWLASNNTTVYYTLATPTNTKITDAALIEQLNAVHQWLTRYGYNSTVAGNLPIIITRTNL